MKHICCIILCFCTSIGSYAQNFADYFQNKTLRVDYIFTGDATQQAIYLDELSQLPTWAGRQHHLSELPLEGNGQIIVKDLASKQCIYKTSFSSSIATSPFAISSSTDASSACSSAISCEISSSLRALISASI